MPGEVGSCWHRGPPHPSPPEVPTLCGRATEELPTCSVHKKGVRGLGVGGVYHPDSRAWRTCHCNCRFGCLDRQAKGWGSWGAMSSPPASAWCGPCQVWPPISPPPTALSPGHRRLSAFPAAGGTGAGKVASHHLLKGEPPVLRPGRKLGPGVWLLHPQRALGFLLMLPRHLEGRAGEQVKG